MTTVDGTAPVTGVRPALRLWLACAALVISTSEADLNHATDTLRPHPSRPPGAAMPHPWPSLRSRRTWQNAISEVAGHHRRQSETVLPAAVAPVGWDGSASLIALLNDRGTPITRAERVFSADAADSDDSCWPDIEPGTPILVVTGVNTDLEGHDIMRVRHHVRADRAEYAVRLPGSRR